VLGLVVWVALMAAIVGRMPARLAPGPVAAVFVFAGPTCWFVGIGVSWAYRSCLRGLVERRYRRFLGPAPAPPPGAPPAPARRRDPPRYPRAFVETLPRWARHGLLVLPDPAPRQSPDPRYLPVPKPFAQMSADELDAWVEDAAALMIGSLGEEGGHP
jgi:hypothetical protein